MNLWIALLNFSEPALAGPPFGLMESYRPTAAGPQGGLGRGL